MLFIDVVTCLWVASATKIPGASFKSPKKLLWVTLIIQPYSSKMLSQDRSQYLLEDIDLSDKNLQKIMYGLNIAKGDLAHPRC